jgi:hypothetical protein
LAVVEAFSEKRPVVEEDLHRVLANTVPLAAATMEEQIRRSGSWAHDCALMPGRTSGDFS